jgi:hypothetical protein
MPEVRQAHRTGPLHAHQELQGGLIMPQGGNLPFGLAPQGSMSSYTPTLRERATDWMRRTLFSDDRAGQGRAEKVMDVASMTPFGFGVDMYDAGREAGLGNYGAAAGTLAMAGAPGPSPKGIRAYHGSPHDFDAFSMSKIGTGEGAQAYGHGLYFAENEGIAKSYRETLAGKPKPSSFELGGVDAWQNYDNLPLEAKRGIGELHARLSPYKDPSSPDLIAQTQRGLENTIKNYETGAIPMDERGYEDAKAALNVLTNGDFRVRPAETPGRMYEVNIDADPDTFLDWDKPLSEQPEVVRLRIEAAGIAPESADLGSFAGVPIQSAPRWADTPQAAQALREAGIPGIKYLDAGSRGAGDGTRNYVVFDDKLISIVRKYGIAGASAMLGYNILDGMDPAQAEELKKIEGN